MIIQFAEETFHFSTLFPCYFVKKTLYERRKLSSTAWKVSKYGDFSGPYFPAFGPDFRIWTLFKQCRFLNASLHRATPECEILTGLIMLAEYFPNFDFMQLFILLFDGFLDQISLLISNELWGINFYYLHPEIKRKPILSWWF